MARNGCNWDGSIMSIHLLRHGILKGPSGGGGGGVALVGTNYKTGANNQPNIILNKPSGLSNGDQWVIAIAQYGGHDTTAPPSPWVVKHNSANYNVRLLCYARTIDGSEGSSLTLVQSGGGYSYWTGISFGLRGVTTGGATATTSEAGAVTSLAGPTISASAGSAIS